MMHRLAACVACVVFLVAAPSRADGPPIVRKVEPPSWWSPPAGAEVMLLVEGQDLKGASVSVDRPGVEVVRAVCPNGGSSLFVDLKLAPGVSPGEVTLRFEAEGQKAERAWTILPPPDRQPDPLGPDDVIYLVMPDRFANGAPSNDSTETTERMLDRSNPHAYHGGDFAGIQARLPYLKDLGVTALWLTPVYKAAPTWFRPPGNRGARLYADFHGYSPIDFYDTNPRFGSRQEYRALVDEAHRLGLKVIQDHIVGFTGPQHRWVKQPPAPGWFHGPVDRPISCNFRFEALADPHARESDRRGMTDGWFFGILPDLDTQNDRVKRYAIQQSLWWSEVFHADAIRLDTYPMVDRAVWRDWTGAHKALHPGMVSVGEAWVNDADLLSFFPGGRPGWDGIDPGVETVFDFPLNFALIDVVSNGADASRLGKALAKDFLFLHPDRLVTFLDNHDTPRLADMKAVSPARYRLAAAFLLTARGIPQLTWGDEIALGGHGDDRRTIPGGWPGDTRDAFTREGRAPGENVTFDAFRNLLALRRDHPALRRGTLAEVAATPSVYAYLRESGEDRVLVVLNFGSGTARVPLPPGIVAPDARFERLYGEGAVARGGREAVAEVPAGAAGVFSMHP